MRVDPRRAGVIIAACVTLLWPACLSAEDKPLSLRLWTIPDTNSSDPRDAANAKIIELFKQRHPGITLRKTAGIQIPQIGGSAALLMSIAGGVAPDVLELSQDNLYSFVSQGFLVPLDDYVKDIPEAERYTRAPKQVWDAGRMIGPDGKAHLYAIPSYYQVSALSVRSDVLTQLGFDKTKWPRTWAQLYAISQDICAGPGDRRGFGLPRGSSEMADVYLTLLVAAGGRPWKVDDAGKLWATFDDDAAAETLDFLWKLAIGLWERDGKKYDGVSYSDVDMWYALKRQRYLMRLTSVSGDAGLLRSADVSRFRLLPVPAVSADVVARPRLYADYKGVFAGQTDPRVRQAAFDFIQLFGSREAKAIRTKAFVEADQAENANPLDLELFGYTRELARFPEGYADFYRRSLADGYMPPVGPGADELLRAIAKPIQLVLADASLAKLSDDARRERIRAVLRAAVEDANKRLHQSLPPQEARQRKTIALLLAILIFGSFAFQLWLVQRTYAAKLGVKLAQGRTHRVGGGSKLFKITLTLFPAMALIALWEYYPLLRGTMIAFEDYRFLEGTRVVGLENFSRVVFSEAFWLAVLRTLEYTVLSIGLGFFAPVVLAILLHSLPRGTLLFRILYYLPALTTGIVVVFLWKSFYDPGPSGLLNYLLSFVRVAPQKWLDDPHLAMLCCVLPTAWAGMGVGSLIYLAALKSIPVELFEAAALDGCSFWKRIRNVAIPFLKPLMIINLVGVLIGTFQSAGYILVLTGGGPSDATNVVSLEIFYEAYARLSFGTATAMSWILAFMLIGFTLFQIRYLARLEFRSAGAAA